jgi:16S rRNA (cytosine1402-N4)-methyltransferase
LPQNNNQKPINFKLETKKPLTPSEEELKINNRARSAKLRCLTKIKSGGANA